MADIFYTDADPIDDIIYPLPEQPVRRRTANWRLAVLVTAMMLTLPAGLYLVGLASIRLAAIGAGVMVLELVIWLLTAWRFNRL